MDEVRVVKIQVTREMSLLSFDRQPQNKSASTSRAFFRLPTPIVAQFLVISPDTLVVCGAMLKPSDQDAEQGDVEYETASLNDNTLPKSAHVFIVEQCDPDERTSGDEERYRPNSSFGSGPLDNSSSDFQQPLTEFRINPNLSLFEPPILALVPDSLQTGPLSRGLKFYMPKPAAARRAS